MRDIKHTYKWHGNSIARAHAKGCCIQNRSEAHNPAGGAAMPARHPDCEAGPICARANRGRVRWWGCVPASSEGSGSAQVRPRKGSSFSKRGRFRTPVVDGVIGNCEARQAEEAATVVEASASAYTADMFADSLPQPSKLHDTTERSQPCIIVESPI